VRIKTARPLAFDTYAEERTTGAFVLVDEASNGTVAAGLNHRRGITNMTNGFVSLVGAGPGHPTT